MKIIAILYCLLISSAITNGEKVCDEKEVELLHWNFEEGKGFEGVKKQMVVFTKEVAQPRIKATRMKLTHKAIYCPAILGMIVDSGCQRMEETISLGLLSIQSAVDNSLCPRGQSCSDGRCDGLSQEDCFNRPLIGTMKPNTIERTPLSGSLIHHQCSDVWECTLITGELEVMMMEEDKIQILGSMTTSCNMTMSERICANPLGESVYLHSLVEVKHSTITLACLIGTQERLCFDEDEGTSIYLDRNGYSFERNKRYRSIGQHEANLDGKFVFVNAPANLLDLQKVYHTLQFENLQTVYDFKILEKTVNKAKELLVSVTLHMMGATPDPLFFYRRGESKLVKSNWTHTKITPCRSRPNELWKEGPIGDVDETSRNIFPSYNLSLYEYKKIDFHLDTLDLDTVIKMLEVEERKRTSETVSFSLGFDFNKSIWQPLCHFFYVSSAWVAWLSFIASIYIVSILIKRNNS
jgi:hypothetical protein